MNYNQKILERALKEEMNKANITYNKYREILDTCKVALNDESNALYVLYSLVESELIPVRVFQDVRTFFYKVEVNETVEKDFICKLIDELFSIYQKGLIDNTLWRFLEGELTSYIGKHYRGISGANPGVVIADEMHEHPGRPFLEKAYNDSKTKKSFVDKIKDVWSKNESDAAFEPFKPMGGIVAPYDINYVPIQASIKEAVEKDAYAAVLEEWQESFDKWKEEQTEVFARMNEVADKVNKIYAVLNERVHPLVKRIDNDVHQVKKQTEASALNTTNTTIHYTGGQITEEQAKEFVSKVKNDLAKSMREERLKGKVW